MARSMWSVHILLLVTVTFCLSTLSFTSAKETSRKSVKRITAAEWERALSDHPELREAITVADNGEIHPYVHSRNRRTIGRVFDMFRGLFDRLFGGGKKGGGGGGGYGAPKRPTASYGPPKKPSASYGPPKNPNPGYGPPKNPNPGYGPPQGQKPGYGQPGPRPRPPGPRPRPRPPAPPSRPRAPRPQGPRPQAQAGYGRPQQAPAGYGGPQQQAPAGYGGPQQQAPAGYGGPQQQAPAGYGGPQQVPNQSNYGRAPQGPRQPVFGGGQQAPAVGNGGDIDGYGSPQAPVVGGGGDIDGYGSPQAPPIGGGDIDGYGSPQAPPIGGGDIDGYGSPQAPVIGGGGDIDGYGSPQAPAIGGYDSPRAPVIGGSNGGFPSYGNNVGGRRPAFNNGGPSIQLSVGAPFPLAPTRDTALPTAASLADSVFRMIPAPNLATEGPPSTRGNAQANVDSYDSPRAPVIGGGGGFLQAANSYGSPQGQAVGGASSGNNYGSPVAPTASSNPFLGNSAPPLSIYTSQSPLPVQPASGSYGSPQNNIIVGTGKAPAPDAYGSPSVGPITDIDLPSNTPGAVAPGLEPRGQPVVSQQDIYGSPLAPVGTSAPVPQDIINQIGNIDGRSDVSPPETVPSQKECEDAIDELKKKALDDIEDQLESAISDPASRELIYGMVKREFEKELDRIGIGSDPQEICCQIAKEVADAILEEIQKSLEDEIEDPLLRQQAFEMIQQELENEFACPLTNEVRDNLDGYGNTLDVHSNLLPSGSGSGSVPEGELVSAIEEEIIGEIVDEIQKDLDDPEKVTDPEEQKFLKEFINTIEYIGNDQSDGISQGDDDIGVVSTGGRDGGANDPCARFAGQGGVGSLGIPENCRGNVVNDKPIFPNLRDNVADPPATATARPSVDLSGGFVDFSNGVLSDGRSTAGEINLTGTTTAIPAYGEADVATERSYDVESEDDARADQQASATTAPDEYVDESYDYTTVSPNFVYEYEEYDDDEDIDDYEEGEQGYDVQLPDTPLDASLSGAGEREEYDEGEYEEEYQNGDTLEYDNGIDGNFEEEPPITTSRPSLISIPLVIEEDDDVGVPGGGGGDPTVILAGTEEVRKPDTLYGGPPAEIDLRQSRQTNANSPAHSQGVRISPPSSFQQFLDPPQAKRQVKAKDLPVSRVLSGRGGQDWSQRLNERRRQRIWRQFNLDRRQGRVYFNNHRGA